MTKSENESGFVSHLAELRKRLIHSFIFLFIFFIGCYFFSENLYGFLVEPFAAAVKENGSDRRLIFTALQETFLTYLKVSFFAAFFVTCPYILMQIWKFIAPGLYKHEKIAIIVLGPKDFPIMLKKAGSWIGTAKKYINNIQNEVSNIDIESNEIEKPKEKDKNNDKI